MATRNKSIRFCDNNLLEDLPDSSIAVASELTNFDKEFVIDDQRTKVYRPNGNFTIGSDNNSLYINTGAPITVTLTSADYTGGVALAAHIQTQLNAASTNWLCTYSTTTYRFTISRTAGTDTLAFTQTTNAVWDTLGYTTAVDTSAAIAGVSDELRIHTDERFTFDLGTALNVESFHCIGPLDEIFSISTTATVTLMGNTSDSWTAPGLTVVMSADSGGIHHFLDNEITSEFRYWRFVFSDRTNTAGPQSFKIGHIYIGDYATVTTTNVGIGFQKGYDDQSIEFESDSGVKYYRTKTKKRVFGGMQIGFIYAPERVTLENLYEKLGNSSMFYLCIDPTSAVSATLSEVTMYCRFNAPPEFINDIRDLYTMSFSTTEAV